MKRIELTVKEYAFRERVSERTVRRWIADEAVQVRRTPGGGVRIIDYEDRRNGLVFFNTTEGPMGA